MASNTYHQAAAIRILPAWAYHQSTGTAIHILPTYQITAIHMILTWAYYQSIEIPMLPAWTYHQSTCTVIRILPA